MAHLLVDKLANFSKRVEATAPIVLSSEDKDVLREIDAQVKGRPVVFLLSFWLIWRVCVVDNLFSTGVVLSVLSRLNQEFQDSLADQGEVDYGFTVFRFEICPVSVQHNVLCRPLC